MGSLNISKAIREKIYLMILAAGVVCFGFIFPDSLSDHSKILHFAAHFGMSFLFLSSLFAVCNIKCRLSKRSSYFIAIALTLVIGTLYKYAEISSQGLFRRFAFFESLQISGCLTSMSQNMAGILAAMLIIQYIFNQRIIILPSLGSRLQSVVGQESYRK